MSHRKRKSEPAGAKVVMEVVEEALTLDRRASLRSTGSADEAIPAGTPKKLKTEMTLTLEEQREKARKWAEENLRAPATPDKGKTIRSVSSQEEEEAVEPSRSSTLRRPSLPAVKASPATKSSPFTSKPAAKTKTKFSAGPFMEEEDHDDETVPAIRKSSRRSSVMNSNLSEAAASHRPVTRRYIFTL